MNAHHWLYQATQDMPEGVSQRVTAETLAHLQEARLPADADVRPLLGDPEETAEGLRRLYLTDKEWLDLREGGSFRTGLNLSGWLVGLVWPVFLFSVAWQEPTSWHLLLLAAYLSGLGWTWGFHPVRRRNWRLLLVFLSAYLLSGLMNVLEGLGIGSELFPVVAVLFVAVAMYRHWTQDARLRRTLALQREKA